MTAIVFTVIFGGFALVSLANDDANATRQYIIIGLLFLVMGKL